MQGGKKRGEGGVTIELGGLMPIPGPCKGKAGFMIQTDARVKNVPRALSKFNYFPPWNSFEHLNLVMGAALTQLLQNLEIEFVYPVNNKPKSLLLKKLI